ncbi:hypothetical protein BIY23_04675 [Wolbachia pipientis]|uniref:Cold shock-like protein CspA n=1 Tax=Wolbachia pipientis TaxID=955 RepID=A0A1E7QK47_WOLPI|nr:cold shock domain-containing protein [Wolbachia pipientis]OEY86845.1 hypothetical protein BIY23_04675 [Wolbachia pipientis]
MEYGNLKWFDVARGFGFIEPDNKEEKEEVFVHASEFTRSGININTLKVARHGRPGQRLSYDLETKTNKKTGKTQIFAIKLRLVEE